MSLLGEQGPDETDLEIGKLRERVRELELELNAANEGRFAALDLQWTTRTRLDEETEACARLVEASPLAPGTLLGVKQNWLKDQITAAIRARGGK